ncbi:MmcQ/YjbR family DNA-binding protein [Lactiplantibacillus plantarum]|uniref:MmcQ/YjbR family DNA-binding protein n=1 Tax=Lactiplantibacillus plantarum TaxID=1590 RepID=UPI0013642AA2|nr:MmcQ/YjbR family DNA-binding protein [Lactiplantibacillus plantarum]QHM30367.1 hypothetical protein C7M34_00989 [Lactiplantibacillus plantarum]
MARVRFENKRVNMSKLSQFGFEPNQNGQYQFRILIMQGLIELNTDGSLNTTLTDTTTSEVYVLHLTSQAHGQFVGQVAQAYQDVLYNIEQHCYDNDVFQSTPERKLIAQVRAVYGDDLEFLWPKFPQNAVWRRSDTHKWYGALLTVTSDKLALPGATHVVTVLDLRARPEDLSMLIDGQHYLPGYHMNKKHWYSILLDDVVPLATIMDDVKVSYMLAK